MNKIVHGNKKITDFKIITEFFNHFSQQNINNICGW